jgi:hypothetical protein
MAMINKKTEFSVEGFRIMRNNPDGTLPSADRLLGFVNTVDLTAIGTDETGTLTIKKDDGSAESKNVDFSAAVDITAVTVAEAITALTTAAFTGMTWSQDSDTSRLKGVSATGTYIQVYGELAPLLDFGYGVLHGGEGLKFVKCFDNTTQIGLPKNIKDKEEIEVESGNGTLITMLIESIIKGLNPTIALMDDDYDLKELIQGGTYDRTANTYDPPTTSITTKPVFNIEVYVPIYSKGTQKREDMSGYKKLLLRSCTGTEGDLTLDVKAWASHAYNITASEYTDENSVLWAAWQEGTLTTAQFAALDVENV